MNFLIKIIFISTFFLFSSAYSNTKNQIIFKLDNKIYTTIDLKNRKGYLELLNKTQLIKDESILNDLINISIYNTFFYKTKNKLTKKSIDNFYNNFFYQYEISNDESYFTEIFKNLSKEIILKNIKYDLQKKNIIEEKLNKQKDIIFNNNKSELEILYDIQINYFLIKKELLKKIKTIVNDLNYNKINKKITEIQKQNINILHKTKNIQDINNLDIELKKNILLNKKYFYIENNSNILIGKIIKKLKFEDKLNFSLNQIITKKEIPKELINCENIKILKNNQAYEIINKEINYNKINKNLKLKLNTVNDFVTYKNENNIIYIILCKIKFDKKAYEQLNINDRINNLVKEIDKEFILINKKKYNLEIIND